MDETRVTDPQALPEIETFEGWLCACGDFMPRRADSCDQCGAPCIPPPWPSTGFGEKGWFFQLYMHEWDERTELYGPFANREAAQDDAEKHLRCPLWVQQALRTV